MVTNRFFTPLAGLPNSRLVFSMAAYNYGVAGLELSWQDFVDLAGRSARSDKRLLAEAKAQRSLHDKLIKAYSARSNHQELKKKARDPRALKMNPQAIIFDLSPDFAQAPPLAAIVNARSCNSLSG